ncbi:TonB-dependent receptor [Fulvivirga sp. M361]|uniref:SusC/RagA family TonB-linked outer membrane protein n=1 Tax=Fulvivirga sp. M361 TaxID=2594266 RepID=UPI001179C1B9|nr:TonB-dependent receptor [Fulvivirga sp. M361]TRX60182.1 TonB-dependent receptor [Fulvivirga sp. M361]
MRYRSIIRFQIILIVFLGVQAVPCFSQTATKRLTQNPIELRGRVVDAEDKQPVPGATVMLKSTKQGTACDRDGHFSLLVSSEDSVIISAIGFTPLQQPARLIEGAPLIELTPDIMSLQEVVVTGYGSQKKKEVIGSISSVSAREIESTTSLSVDNAIAGKAAGVLVNSSSGVPGSATSITIRGLTSLSGDANNPLIVIDGVPVYGTGQDLNTTNFSESVTGVISVSGGTRVASSFDLQPEFERNPLANINPADIESIEILKDAYATAIYGSRGAAGVVLITTKKGSRGHTKLDFSYVTGVLQPVDTHDLLNSEQYNDIYNKYFRRDINTTPNTNWQDEVIREPVVSDVGLSISGGDKRGSYFVSGAYTSQPSYIINQGFERYSGRINLTYNSSEKISFGTNTVITYTDNQALNAQQVYYDAILKSPSLPVLDEEGEYYFDLDETNGLGLPNVNPVAVANKNINSLEDTRTVSTIYATVDFFDWLSAKSEVGIDLYNSRAYSRRAAAPGFLPNGEAIETTSQNRKLVINNTVTIDRLFKEFHYLSAVLGQSFETSNEQVTSISSDNFPNDNILSIGATNSADRLVRGAISREWALTSYFARVNYHYKNKYLGGITYRLDGSSRFAKNNRYVGFPAFSLGWRISEEKFMKNRSLINDLKLRSSLGFSGIQGSGFSSYYGFQGQYVFSNTQYGNLGVLEAQQPPNPDVEWQRTQSIDVGLDVSLWDSKLNFILDYYHKRVNNLLFSSSVPNYLGYSSQEQNLGDMKNEGIEVTINAEVSIGPVQWVSNFNLAANRNKILKLNQQGQFVGRTPTGGKYLKEGEAAGLFFLYQWEGVDPLTGNPLWLDGDGNLSDSPPENRWRVDDSLDRHRKVYGSNQPDFFGGFNNSFIYKALQLDMSFTYSYGNKMFNGSRATLLTYSTGDGSNLSTDILDYWKIAGHQTEIPALRNNSIRLPESATSNDATYDYTVSRESSRFLEDGSFVRLKTVQLSYNFPPALLSKMKNAVRNLKIYVRGTNLLTFTKYTGLDPEVSAFGSNALSGGIDELTMPQSRIMQVGINLGL